MLYLNYHGPNKCCNKTPNLTLTNVVFEFDKITSEENAWQYLTLTNVVFEYL